MEETTENKKGFATLPKEQHKEIARKGGLSLSANKEHMAAIGRKGGAASVRSRYGIRWTKLTDTNIPETEVLAIGYQQEVLVGMIFKNDGYICESDSSVLQNVTHFITVEELRNHLTITPPAAPEVIERTIVG